MLNKVLENIINETAPAGKRACACRVCGHDCAIIAVKSIDSTNDEAKRLIAAAKSPQDIPFGTVIIADEQTGGRGRRGKPFHSPAADSAYMSFILKPTAKAEQMLTIMASVAVCETIEKVADLRGPDGEASTPLIKWVNDIYINERKVCGILTEAITDARSGDIASLVLGIGVNINVPPSDFPPELREIAGSVKIRPQNRNRFIAELITQIFARYDELGRGRSPMDAYRSRSLITGRNVAIIGPDGNARKEVYAESIADDGSLIVKHPDGTTESLRSGEVSLFFQKRRHAEKI
jgi:BirA family biotin operon repressor/biotin-[acetyl-CoA-carboxylase] ligase